MDDEDIITEHEQVIQCYNNIKESMSSESVFQAIEKLESLVCSDFLVESVGTIDAHLTLQCKSTGNAEDICDAEELTKIMTLVMRRFSDNHEILAKASNMVSLTCGETALKERTVKIKLDTCPQLHLSFSLPCFSSGDVGFRIWGSSKAVCVWMIEHNFWMETFVTSVSSKPKPTCLELGCGAFPLVGMIAARMIQAECLYLTDYNEECLLCAKMNAATNQENNMEWFKYPQSIATQQYDWYDYINNPPPKVDLVIGSACVYEDRHAAIVPQAILACGKSNGTHAIIAIHEGHSGFEQFQIECQRLRFDLKQKIGPITVLEDGRLSAVYIFFYAIPGTV